MMRGRRRLSPGRRIIVTGSAIPGLVLAVAWARRRPGGVPAKPDKPAKPELPGGMTARLLRR